MTISPACCGLSIFAQLTVAARIDHGLGRRLLALVRDRSMNSRVRLYRTASSRAAAPGGPHRARPGLAWPARGYGTSPTDGDNTTITVAIAPNDTVCDFDRTGKGARHCAPVPPRLARRSTSGWRIGRLATIRRHRPVRPPATIASKSPRRCRAIAGQSTPIVL